jgi:hypothetical protein
LYILSNLQPKQIRFFSITNKERNTSYQAINYKVQLTANYSKIQYLGEVSSCHSEQSEESSSVVFSVSENEKILYILTNERMVYYRCNKQEYMAYKRFYEKI